MHATLHPDCQRSADDRAPAREAQPSADHAGARTGRSGRMAPNEHFAWGIVGALSAGAIFAMSRPYIGIAHDGFIYIGRAVADLDPAGLGRDILFAMDGQSRFSLFPRILDVLVAEFGPATASATVVALSLTVWLAAAAAFASRIARGRLLWLMLVSVAVVPAFYGASLVFRFGEQYATARALAEAGVTAGLACLMARRPGLALLPLLGAALVHPIMAAPGLGVWILIGVTLYPRFRVVLAGAVIATAAAALVGIPVFDRLATVIDPAWRAGLADNLYPSRWSLADWSTATVQALTVALAIRFVRDASARVLLWAVLGVGVGGLAAATVGGDALSLLLVVQAQTWRVLWLVAFAGAACLPVALTGLWARGPAGRLAAASLVMAWLPDGLPAVALLALAVSWLEARRPGVVSPRLALIGCGAVVAYSLVWFGIRVSFAAHVLAGVPEGASILYGFWNVGLFFLPIGVGAFLWTSMGRSVLGLRSAAVLTAGLVLLAAAWHDDRSALTRRLDQWRPDPALASLLPSRAGDVLWIRQVPTQPWALAGRPNWVSFLQGASNVFSREQALVWTNRMDRAVAAHLADDHDRRFFSTPEPQSTLTPSAADLAAFCAAPDAPVAIVGARRDIRLDGAGLPVRTYRLPAADWTFGGTDPDTWTPTETLQILSCDDARADLRG